MTVLRYKSAKYSIERPLEIGAALAGATPEQLARAGRASGCPSARPSSCATTCSASSATRRSPASPRATTWSRASAPCSSRWPCPRGRAAPTPTRLDAALGSPLGRRRRRRPAPDHRLLRRARPGRAAHRVARRPGRHGAGPSRRSTSTRAACSPSSRPPRPSGPSEPPLAEQSTPASVSKPRPQSSAVTPGRRVPRRAAAPRTARRGRR